MNRIILASISICLLLSVVGCGEGYRISGKVIRGESMLMVFAPADDPRFNQPGLPGATIRIDRDPTTLGRHTVATASGDGEGYFLIPLGEFGVGWMQEQWAITATRLGYEDVSMILDLPRAGSNHHLLIVMPEGVSGGRLREGDLWDQYERYR